MPLSSEPLSIKGEKSPSVTPVTSSLKVSRNFAVLEARRCPRERAQLDDVVCTIGEVAVTVTARSCCRRSSGCLGSAPAAAAACTCASGEVVPL